MKRTHNARRTHNAFIANIFLLLIACSISICFCEFVVRVLPLSDRIGWQRAPSFAKRLEKFNRNAKYKIVVLGDSFAEWRYGEGVNMFDYAAKRFSPAEIAVLNLGKSALGVDCYIEIYKEYVHFTPSLVIICLYLGNDVKNYQSYSEISGIRIQESDEFSVKDFIKQHFLLGNLIFRAGKAKIPILRSKFFERNLETMQKQFKLSDDYIQKRLEHIDRKILDMAKSDMVNPWIPAIGAVNPSYYKDLFALSTKNALNNADVTINLIKEFYTLEKIKNLLVVIIPESLQVSQAYDDFFKKCGFDLDNFPVQKRRLLTHYIQTKLTDTGIKTLDTTDALEKEPDSYIKLDIHLNIKGHKIAGELIADFISNNFEK